ncbi:DUF3040 domain-containing protein [Streptantibioticus rubrisoli]|uniref:DUF3040 domain-containing protein n=1 Tax=Streptantibioticus rubrisoli TaxID=1387313 RepID=A0ABT1PK05_9ACTN|nr:DUF3040 domain-containing protein [Streptantibioticus rubrisoli]MCQ4045698.1 DUF3040 domain-containing protein [Streptantibioticus rubrisoli]
MPLSEHEQRMLEQMERALYAEDPKFASALEGSGLRTFTRRRVYQAVAGFLVGIALLMAGMVAQQIWISVVGFLVMLGCAALAITGWRRSVKPAQQQPGMGMSSGPYGRHPRRKGRVMDRIEERWQRRRDEQQGP